MRSLILYLTIDRSTVSKILLKKEKMAYKQTDFKEFQSKRQQSIDAYFSAS